MVFRVWSTGVPWAGAGCLWVSHGGPCTDVRSYVSIFGMNCPSTCGIPHWNIIINGSICLAGVFMVGRLEGSLLQSGLRPETAVLKACQPVMLSMETAFMMCCDLWFDTLVSFYSCDHLKNEQGAHQFGIPTPFCG